MKSEHLKENNIKLFDNEYEKFKMNTDALTDSKRQGARAFDVPQGWSRSNGSRGRGSNRARGRDVGGAGRLRSVHALR